MLDKAIPKLDINTMIGKTLPKCCLPKSSLVKSGIITAPNEKIDPNMKEAMIGMMAPLPTFNNNKPITLIALIEMAVLTDPIRSKLVQQLA